MNNRYMNSNCKKYFLIRLQPKHSLVQSSLWSFSMGNSKEGDSIVFCWDTSHESQVIKCYMHMISVPNLNSCGFFFCILANWIQHLCTIPLIFWKGHAACYSLYFAKQDKEIVGSHVLTTVFFQCIHISCAAFLQASVMQNALFAENRLCKAGVLCKYRFSHALRWNHTYLLGLVKENVYLKVMVRANRGQMRSDISGVKVFVKLSTEEAHIGRFI